MHLSPMWFGNAWNQWKPASSCAALRAYARRDGLAFIGSERYWDHARAALCGGGMRHVVTLRSPVARARSMLQHLQRHNWRALRRHLRPTSEQLVAILAAAVTHNTSHQAGVATARAGGARRREWRPPPLAAALLRPGAAALAAASADWTWRNLCAAPVPRNGRKPSDLCTVSHTSVGCLRHCLMHCLCTASALPLVRYPHTGTACPGALRAPRNPPHI